ncbi:spermidine synthase [Paenibacillus tuaregi]|uniref:spermidine synthase n=1 Tax=Paenibacillus tuaregi TaxID=1816681 RepID=UPI0008384AC2|nr:fused MFS/spermidine synthase [Paenibacillus tuaregi]
MNILFHDVSPDQEIMVADTTELFGDKGRFRILQFANQAVQGAIDLDAPGRLVFEYPRALLHLMEINNPDYEDVFMVGHGIGAISGHCPDKRFKVAELNPMILGISRDYFGYTGDNVIIGDGRELLKMELDNNLDYILVDAFTELGTPLHLLTREFFHLTQAKLGPRGSVLLNLFGRSGNDTLIQAIHTTLQEVYSHTAAFILPGESAGEAKNILLVGSKSPIHFQARSMAGFTEFEVGPGYTLLDP